MSNTKQTSDHAQKGPGFIGKGGSITSHSAPSAPSVGPAGNSKSGTPSGTHRGKQGRGR